MSYFFPVDTVAADCPSGHLRALGTDVSVVVSGKGELTLRTTPSACLSVAALEYLNPARQEFTITAGTGIFAGASGTGTVTRSLAPTADGASGIETWSGTLMAAGVEFDVTEPALTVGAPKSVRAARGAKTARVTFQVTATDDKDGSLPVSCLPKSGSRFRIGRTTVRCSAGDCEWEHGQVRPSS